MIDPLSMALTLGTGILGHFGRKEAAKEARRMEAIKAKYSPWTGFVPELQRAEQPSLMQDLMKVGGTLMKLNKPEQKTPFMTQADPALAGIGDIATSDASAQYYDPKSMAMKMAQPTMPSIVEQIGSMPSVETQFAPQAQQVEAPAPQPSLMPQQDQPLKYGLGYAQTRAPQRPSLGVPKLDVQMPAWAYMTKPTYG